VHSLETGRSGLLNQESHPMERRLPGLSVDLAGNLQFTCTRQAAFPRSTKNRISTAAGLLRVTHSGSLEVEAKVNPKTGTTLCLFGAGGHAANI